jgi:hypothetical protein
MKKRIFLIVSSIVCCLVSLSLVIYTVAKATQITSSKEPGGKDNPTTDVSKPNYEDVVNTQNIEYNLIVGDSFIDEVLLSNADSMPSILGVSSNSIVAKEAGEGIFVVEANGVRYNYDVKVWAKGKGSQEDPYNIIRIKDLEEYVAGDNSKKTYYIQRTDLDLAGQNWIPLGNEEKSFNDSFDGNGYAIKNMSIVVNEENISDFSCNANGYTSMHLGFFGYVHSAEINNVTIENATIDTTEIDNIDIRADHTIGRMFVGALAGYTYNTKINGGDKNISATIKSSAGDHDGIDGAVGGAIGMLTGASLIKDYSVNSVINASDVAYIKDEVNYGANVAGLVGVLKGSQIQNCTVEADITIGNYKNAKAAGAVVNVVGNSSIKKLIVEKANIQINKVVKNADKCIRMAGAIDYVEGGSKVIYAQVNNANIYGITCGQVSGFVSMNNGTITNCSVNGTLKGVYVAGLADTNNGTIKYTSGDDAVNVEIHAQLWGAGLVNDNCGVIQGVNDKTAVNASIYWYKVAEQYFDSKNSMFAGIATFNSGEISNLYVIANMYEAVNAGGAIGWAKKGEAGAELSNVEVYTTVRTIKENGNSKIQTYTIGGIVAIMDNDSSLKIDSVEAKMSVNAKAISAYKYTLDVFGVFVGECYGALNVDNTNVGVSVYANDTLNVNEKTKDCARVALIGEIKSAVVEKLEISGDILTMVYGNVNVNGTAKSIKAYPSYYAVD